MPRKPAEGFNENRYARQDQGSTDPPKKFQSEERILYTPLRHPPGNEASHGARGKDEENGASEGRRSSTLHVASHCPGSYS